MLYCDRDCQKESWADHKSECSNLKRVAPRVVPDAARLMAKMIFKLKVGILSNYKIIGNRIIDNMYKNFWKFSSQVVIGDPRIFCRLRCLCVKQGQKSIKNSKGCF